jgi:low temperature requirement protein LtrA
LDTFDDMKTNSGHQKPILANEDQPVSFAELFFDLVFVFSVTQVVHVLHGAFDWAHVGRAVLIFWLVWWAWTQFTWALNAADTRHNWIQLGTIVATACAFFMAVSVPESFDSCSWWFAAFYVAVRSIGLLIYLWVSWSEVGMRTAVKTFAVVSIAGLASVITGGILGGEAQYWFWGLTIVLDVIAASVGGNNESWNLHPKHFAERHGLFVIIALGETLIVAASAAASESWDTRLMTVSMLAVGITSCFWWLYFSKTKHQLEHAMSRHKGAAQSTMGRDVFSLLHFPMMCGLIIYAFAIEESMLHPYGALSFQARLALALGILLFPGGLVLAHWRATGRINSIRLVSAILISGACLFISGIAALWTLAIGFGGLLLLCVVEEKLEVES